MLQHLAPVDNPIRNIWNLGYRSLVSILPPDAKVSEHTMLHKRMLAGEDPRGKAPGRKRRDGLWSGYDFTQVDPEEADLDAWLEWGAGCGIRCGDGLVAVDIDTRDKAAAKKVYELAQEILGSANVRFGERPKALLLYATDPAETIPFRKVRFSTATEDAAHVELTTQGKQFVAYGTHPRTGAPYHWPEGIPARDDLTVITQDDLTTFFEAVAEHFEGVTDISQTVADRTQIDQDTLRGKPELVRDAMRNLPNNNDAFPTRNSYLTMGYALKAAMPDEDEALELYHQWAGRWDRNGEHNDPAVVEADWARMKAPFSVGADFIYAKAEQYGGWTGRAEMFFEPQEMEGDAQPQRQGGYQLMSVEDVMLMRPPQFLIDRHLPETGFGILYGDPGCGKSFIALDMALTLAYGLNDWHGDAIQPKGPKKVLYIAGEGASGFQSRIRAWQEMHKEQIQHRQCHAKFLFQSVNFMKPDDIRLLVTAAREVGSEWAMIVVDTVSRAIPGADENLQKDMTIFVHACDALKDAMGAFVLGVHHTAKTGTMRGSSVFLGQADVVLRLTRQKGASIGRLDCEKQKDAPDGWGDAYRLSVVEVGEMGSSLVPCRVDGGSAESGSVDVGLQNIMLRAADAAWKAGEPWSENARSGERFAPRVLSRDFGITVDQASALLDIWLGQRILVSEIVDKRSKKKGLKVAAFIAENADDLSGSEGVFE